MSEKLSILDSIDMWERKNNGEPVSKIARTYGIVEGSVRDRIYKIDIYLDYGSTIDDLKSFHHLLLPYVEDTRHTIGYMMRKWNIHTLKDLKSLTESDIRNGYKFNNGYCDFDVKFTGNTKNMFLKICGFWKDSDEESQKRSVIKILKNGSSNMQYKVEKLKLTTLCRRCGCVFENNNVMVSERGPENIPMLRCPWCGTRLNYSLEYAKKLSEEIKAGDY